MSVTEPTWSAPGPWQFPCLKTVHQYSDSYYRLANQAITEGSRRSTPNLVARFGELVADKLRSRNSALRKSCVRLLVDRVEASTRDMCISGSKAALEHAVLRPTALSTPVPSINREWCPGMDSNHHIVANTST